MPIQQEAISPANQNLEIPEIEKKIHALKKGFKALKDESDSQL